MINTGIYIHVPFCEKKCKYCTFYSRVCSEDIKNKYIQELVKEIKSISQKVKNHIVKTIYIGGGTPSLLDEKDLEYIFNTIYKNYSTDLQECTIEVNPNSAHLFKEYKALGINRISIGIQSFSDELLTKIGRLHNKDEAIKTLESANNYFDNISGDIILGLDKNQDPEFEFNNLSKFVKHISAYMLQLEEDTPLYTDVKLGKTQVANEDEAASQYERFLSICESNGFMRYEISNFAKLGFESKHNSSYWDLTPYIGFGPAAHSYLNGRRYYNEEDLQKYIQGKHSGNNLEILEREKSVVEDESEYVMLSLRTSKGLDLELFRKMFNNDFLHKYKQQLASIQKYIENTGTHIRIKPEYLILQNSILEILE